MTPQDREQFRALTLRQAQLEEALAQLRKEFMELERRAESDETPAEWIAEIPPLPLAAEAPAALPPLPPLPPLPEIPSAPEAAVSEEEKQGGLEFQFGRWLARIGVVFALITLITFSTLAYNTFYKYMGSWSKLAVLAAVSLSLVAAGPED